MDLLNLFNNFFGACAPAYAGESKCAATCIEAGLIIPLNKSFRKIPTNYKTII